MGIYLCLVLYAAENEFKSPGKTAEEVGGLCQTAEGFG